MTDSLTRSIIINAPRSRVWKALTDHQQFGAWFGVELAAAFRAGRPAHGAMTVPGFEGMKFTIDIERVEPETHFAFRWHPYAIDPNVDYTSETKTLVTFVLSDVPGGTKVEVTESGFDSLPPHRYPDAFRKNGQGWTIQTENIRNYVENR